MKWISKDFIYRPKVRKHFSLVLIGFLLGIVAYDYVNFSGYQSTGELFSSGFLGILIAYIVHYSNLPINTVLPWKKQPGLRLLAGILIHLMIGLLLVFGTLWMYGKLNAQVSLFEITYSQSN